MSTQDKLKELLSSIPGAFAAGEFTDDGRLVAYYGDIDQKSAEMAAMMCAANKLMANMQAKGWTEYTGQGGFYPVYGFAVAGGKYAACIMGNVGVFVELSKADFDKTFEVLSKYI
jgi:roadblock/LC7 domain-containing protein